MMAAPLDERRMTRPEYWKRVALLLLGSFLLGMVFYDLPPEQFATLQGFSGLVSWILGVIWGRARCRDAGWHPAWAFLNFSFLSFFIFGLPKSKVHVLELVREGPRSPGIRF